MSKVPWRTLLIGELSWRRLVMSVLFIYGFFAIYVYFRADSMIFLPPPSSYQDSPDILKIQVTPTERISALYSTTPRAAYTILYIHGNASDLGLSRPLITQWVGLGFNVLAFDYRGYGTSDGQPSEKNAYQDAEAAYTYLTQVLKIPPAQIIIYGRSVGSGSATELASRHPVAGLILESAFTSAFRVVVPFPILPFDKFPNQAKLRHVRCPVLVMHGRADTIVPFSHGQALYETATTPKLSLWVEGADHNDFVDVAGERYSQMLIEFQKLVAAQPR
jgi:abhydrolase domain-containing protein 17